MSKEKRECPNCGKEFFRYIYSYSGNAICCSKKCSTEYIVKNGLSKGKNNSNYRNGFSCEKSYCECGNLKDHRSNKCSKCSNRSFPMRDAEGRFINEELIINKSKNSESYVEIAQKTGYSRHNVKKVLIDNNIDTFHFRVKQTEESVLNSAFTNPSKISHAVIKSYIMKYNILEYKCKDCGIIDEYNGKKITIQLHHMDGNRHNNTLSNLRFLCPNCHSQTHTYCGANKHKYNKNEKHNKTTNC